MRLQNSKIYLDDLDTAIGHSIGIEKLKGAKILITGATGTIGSFLTDMLLRYNMNTNAQIEVCVAGRNMYKLFDTFYEWKDPNFSIVEYDVNLPIGFEKPADYIIHAAGNAHPAAINSDPVGTIMGNICGTYNMLEYGKKHGTKRLLYVSSGEVYGQGNLTLSEFEEAYAGYIDTLVPRSCYPSSKRAAENLCASFSSQFGLETVIVRPCHTYGPSITSTDSRANVQFFRNVLKGEDIVMKSDGSQVRSYNYIADCASAIFTVLVNGGAGESYNIANPSIKISIAELAQIIAKISGKRVVFSEPTIMDLKNRTPIIKQVLSSKKIENMGWHEAFSIEAGIDHTLRILQGQ